MNRVLNRLADLAWSAWFHRPVITLNSRVQNAIDEADVSGYLKGHATALDSLGAVEPASIEVAALMGSIAGKIAAGQITHYDLRTAIAALEGVANPQPKQHAVRRTTSGYALAVVAS